MKWLLKKRWIIRALGPVVDLAPFFIETWRCDLCDYLFHRIDKTGKIQKYILTARRPATTPE